MIFGFIQHASAACNREGKREQEKDPSGRGHMLAPGRRVGADEAGGVWVDARRGLAPSGGVG